MFPREIYTDRTEFIDYFYNTALRAIDRRTMSTVLLGQRRMGKTEIFKRVVNRLFFEQDHEDRNAAISVYYIFPDDIGSAKEFAIAISRITISGLSVECRTRWNLPHALILSRDRP